MNRRDFLKRLGLATAGIVAADQLEIIERLGWKRRFFQGFTPAPSGLFLPKEFALGFMITREMLEDDMYGSVNEFVKKHEMVMKSNFLDDTFIVTPKRVGLLHGSFGPRLPR
jgi:hypothetical protein